MALIKQQSYCIIFCSAAVVLFFKDFTEQYAPNWLTKGLKMTIKTTSCVIFSRKQEAHIKIPVLLVIHEMSQISVQKMLASTQVHIIEYETYY